MTSVVKPFPDNPPQSGHNFKSKTKQDQTQENTSMNITFPTFHPGGSDREILTDDYGHRVSAVTDALDLLREEGPQYRDYPHHICPGRYARAVEDHLNRLRDLERILAELGALEQFCKNPAPHAPSTPVGSSHA